MKLVGGGIVLGVAVPPIRGVTIGAPSRWPWPISLSSVLVEKASTSPVVMVALRIYSVSRCKVTEKPCTLMLATWPTGRMS